jgi:hypothetical protein
MANKVFDYYKELPSWAKGVVVVGGLAVTYIFASQIIKKLKQDAEQKKRQGEVISAEEEYKNLIKSGVKPTINVTMAESISAAIVDASNSCGTDEKKIYSQFDKVNNDADIYLLIKTFGTRKKVRCLFSDDETAGFWSQDTPPMSLSAMLHSELSTNGIATLNKKLSAKKIKYQF